jgi:hypothetical protein
MGGALGRTISMGCESMSLATGGTTDAIKTKATTSPVTNPYEYRNDVGLVL